MVYKDKILLTRLLKIISSKEKKIKMLEKELEAYKELAEKGELNFYFSEEDEKYHIELYNFNEKFGEFSKDVALDRRKIEKEIQKEKKFKTKLYTGEITTSNIHEIIQEKMVVRLKDIQRAGIDEKILDYYCCMNEKTYRVVTTDCEESFIIFEDNK
ncbi:hypothetical protein NMF85_10710 [Clostridioides difficile]|uniref:hypothetical protein n=1 Tax=Clostridioides difficile TaxID=1496 RepID=UPI001430047A|nr:hypothetical protein [Clostridioides difficile]MCK3747751.1 hypothetical protein [Clostridioides difficile]MCP8397038.1 hypothetical protein [Clostridioides difficile]MCP8415778.1 hypothetical protein [Clostridioides difficile]MCP8493752.1 hypothetical protein [Clostridioides difficile]MCP8656864.1 hypothetical protein [Clostridioides difficile]